MNSTTEKLEGRLAKLERATEWRTVPGWPYEASDTGILRSARTGKPIKPTLNHKGYERCMFQVDKVKKDVRVHRAVAEAWIGPIPTGHHVNHLDGDKTNNSPSNLEIVTAAENEAHAVANGLKASGDRNGVRTRPDRVARGARAGQAKLSDAQVTAIRKARSEGEKLSELAAQFGVSQSLISLIARRKIWAHI